MKKRRLFVGLPVSDPTKTLLQRQLPQLIPGKVTPASNWHITIQFLGSVEEFKLPEIQEILRVRAKFCAPFDLTLQGLRTFGAAQKARHLWIEVKGEGCLHLRGLADQIREDLNNLGFLPENRPFTPHITISRFSSPQDVTDFIAAHSLSDIKEKVREIILYESILATAEQTHSIYQPIYKAQLSSPGES